MPNATGARSGPGRAGGDGAGRVRVGEDDGRRVLLVDGVVQSVAVGDGPVEGYWAALLPDVRPRRALLLGLGGGTVVHLLRRRFGPVAVVAVEADAEVLALARAEFGLQWPELTVRLEDAFGFVAACRERFDYVCVDLYRGEQPERGILTRPFLRGLKALANPGAEIALNLFLDRRAATAVQRIGRVLTVRTAQRIGKNLVVKAGLR